MIITVDCGTTNMRCRLFNGTVLLDEVCRRAGVRNTAFDGTADFLRTSLKESVSGLLLRNSLKESNIEVIVSSGTLASDVGIYTVPHVLAPVGVNESAAYARLVTLDDITAIPIFFIPGVKTLPGEDETDGGKIIEALESMSGEECETYGIMAQLGLEGDFAITLPGSYNKAMEINGEGQIVSIKTGMCGEFIAAVAEHTLLRRFLPQPVIRTIIPEKLFLGFDYSLGHGVSPTLIKARMVRFMRNWSEDEAANFFVGAILKDDIGITKEICQQGRRLVVGGGNPLRHIFALLLEHAGASGIVEISDEAAHVAPSIGAMKVYEAYLRIKNN